ncbi:putative colanic acid biosysnthesis UDP-glucose lipid carrier transferase [Nitrosomonas marina]|uniref:Putative colanic acid biosysnthesis UDP-glucose lipid carrier transferase n=1 Tax=Nitrosomonas marina TaxID=917 RepID=A0A1I0ETZ5_9PROT|nr:undecaprenyl-phosphate glucose phosphotransferase [Nitrosomonas marina]SET48316.1 putative colanic acid biosysnthesis UDP-glucose lipid carrier transferase [Nitrosomonas marina]
MKTYDLPVIAFFKYILDPTITWSVLLLLIWIFDETFTSHYLVLIILIFFVSSYVYEHTSLYKNWRQGNLFAYIRNTFIGWSIIIAILLFLGHITHFSEHFSRQVIVSWMIVTPLTLIVSHLIVKLIISIQRNRGKQRSSVIIGVNAISQKLLNYITTQPLLFIENRGYFDDRQQPRISGNFGPYLGRTKDIISYLEKNSIDMIFISLPMTSQPRIQQIIEQFSDTTISIYFLPDMYVFDLLQAQVDYIGDMPIVSLGESPYSGIDGVIKIASDYLFATLILILLSPLMLCIAIAVKLTSPGPVIFKQRRYGYNGKEIIVYKFRTMNVTENGNSIVQAKRNDHRVTKIGAFLRRTSLDELPQFVNVLQGRMSVVGPRPHAVAHNEMYRKLIRGYMMRHKTKPGITGWAQVNGWRGETEVLDKMKKRVEHDLYYLNNWSIWLDIWIIIRTVWVVLNRKNAF